MRQSKRRDVVTADEFEEMLKSLSTPHAMERLDLWDRPVDGGAAESDDDDSEAGAADVAGEVARLRASMVEACAAALEACGAPPSDTTDDDASPRAKRSRRRKVETFGKQEKAVADLEAAVAAAGFYVADGVAGVDDGARAELAIYREAAFWLRALLVAAAALRRGSMKKALRRTRPTVNVATLDKCLAATREDAAVRGVAGADVARLLDAVDAPRAPRGRRRRARRRRRGSLALPRRAARRVAREADAGLAAALRAFDAGAARYWLSVAALDDLDNAVFAAARQLLRGLGEAAAATFRRSARARDGRPFLLAGAFAPLAVEDLTPPTPKLVALSWAFRQARVARRGAATLSPLQRVVAMRLWRHCVPILAGADDALRSCAHVVVHVNELLGVVARRGLRAYEDDRKLAADLAARGGSPPTSDSDASSESDGEPGFWVVRTKHARTARVGAVAVAVFALADAGALPSPAVRGTVEGALEFARDRATAADDALQALRLGAARAVLHLEPPGWRAEGAEARGDDAPWETLAEAHFDYGAATAEDLERLAAEGGEPYVAPEPEPPLRVEVRREVDRRRALARSHPRTDRAQRLLPSLARKRRDLDALEVARDARLARGETAAHPDFKNPVGEGHSQRGSVVYDRRPSLQPHLEPSPVDRPRALSRVAEDDGASDDDADDEGFVVVPRRSFVVEEEEEEEEDAPPEASSAPPARTASYLEIRDDDAPAVRDRTTSSVDLAYAASKDRKAAASQMAELARAMALKRNAGGGEVVHVGVGSQEHPDHPPDAPAASPAPAPKAKRAAGRGRRKPGGFVSRFTRG
ncbi:hypothetical protein JL722_13354 [Aureococcus anophagefferens]|nr:hypothetical protein JL722_13354 [Aureococcus anophagefferens]